jgi:hypothetical protein
LDLAIDTENLRHLLLELGIAAFQIGADLVRLDSLTAEDLAHRSLHQIGKIVVSRRRSILACVVLSTTRADRGERGILSQCNG